MDGNEFDYFELTLDEIKEEISSIERHTASTSSSLDTLISLTKKNNELLQKIADSLASIEYNTSN